MRSPFFRLIPLAAAVALGACQQEPDASLLALEQGTAAPPGTALTMPFEARTKAVTARPLQPARTARAKMSDKASKKGRDELPRVTSNYFAGRGIDGLPSGWTPLYAPADIAGELSAHCRALLAEAGVEATVLRTPSASADMRDDGNWSVGVGYDFLDLRRATLKEELALARCDRSLVSLRLAQLLVTSAQSLSRSGYLAVANHLRASRGRLRKIARQITAAVDIGDMTRARAAMLRQYMQQTRAREAKVRAEAARREVVDRMHRRSFKALDERLREAERRVARLERETRTVDAVNVRLSARYGGGFEDKVQGTISRAEPGEVSARLKVSMRLGALSRKRYEYERLLEEARLDRFDERETGIFWRTRELVRANSRVLEGLRAERIQLLDALVQTKGNSVVPDHDPDMIATALRARVDTIALSAQLKGVEATIAHMATVNRRLRFQR